MAYKSTKGLVDMYAFMPDKAVYEEIDKNELGKHYNPIMHESICTCLHLYFSTQQLNGNKTKPSTKLIV